MSPQNKETLLKKSADDVVIVSALRTAHTKGKRGLFKDTRPEELLSTVLRASYSSVNLDPKLIEDVTVGNVLPAGGGASAARMAALHAGIPNTSSVYTVNRQCSSGLTAVNNIANQIKVGQIDIGIGAGVESMTFGFGAGAQPDGWSEAVLSNQEAEDCLIPMGITSENVGKQFGVTRADQDAFAALSFQKAAKAQKEGLFKREIVPVKTKVEVLAKGQEAGDGEVKEVVVEIDDGIREGVTKESLGKLKPAFSKDGSTHAGNASQVSDGASAVLLARRSVAEKLGLPILGKFVCASVVGVPPRIMGVGPAFAIPKVLETVGITKDEVDFYEINEAFASQAVMSIRHVGIDENKVNLWGGAIAFGHPLGSTGSRQIATGLSVAKHTGGKVFVTSMCIGSGMGMAAVFVSEQ